LVALSAGAGLAAPLAKHCGPKDKYVIGFSQANYAEPYRQHVNNDLIELAKAIPQFELQIADGAGNDNTQTSQVDNFVTQGVDLLMISPFEAAPLTPAVARAMKAGIPVIELDRQTNGTPGKDYTAFVGGDNYKIAYEAGTYTAKTLLPDGGDVAVLEGLPSSTPAVQRLNGFKDGVKQNPKIKVVAEQAADWVPDKAQTAFSAMLQANPDIKVVYASNDMMAAGSYLAAKGAGKEGKIGIIGTDGLPGPAGGVTVGGDVHISDGRRRVARPRQENPARLRGIGARHRDGADPRDHQGQRGGPRQEAEVLRSEKSTGAGWAYPGPRRSY
jgi:ribose transport system substrate-binding protein